VLQPLTAEDLRVILERALADGDRGLGALGLRADDEALDMIALEADGDARRALNALESAAALASDTRHITADLAREALQLRFARYDKGGEEHYNLISALHKAVRGSDPDGALYWLARMLDGGEDPLYIARRIIRMAIEDIGLADPQALPLTIAARDAFQMLGSPEGELALAEAAVYLATCPKSNRLYRAMGEASDAARATPAAPVPLHIRNAPTGLMRQLGYGKGYRYAFDEDVHYSPQEYLPDQLQGQRFYEPSEFGYEKRISERLAWWTDLKRGTSTPDNEALGSGNDDSSG
jgi:putative ATPase